MLLPFLQVLSAAQNSPASQVTLQEVLFGFLHVFSPVFSDSLQTVLFLLFEQSELELQGSMKMVKNDFILAQK